MILDSILVDICPIEGPQNSASAVAADDCLDDVPELVDNMHNFVLVVTPSFEIIYVTDNVRLLLGLSQVRVNNILC